MKNYKKLLLPIIAIVPLALSSFTSDKHSQEQLANGSLTHVNMKETGGDTAFSSLVVFSTVSKTQNVNTFTKRQSTSIAEASGLSGIVPAYNVNMSDILESYK